MGTISSEQLCNMALLSHNKGSHERWGHDLVFFDTLIDYRKEELPGTHHVAVPTITYHPIMPERNRQNLTYPYFVGQQRHIITIAQIAHAILGGSK